jgi:cob(I)alamin adenosyltransferase
MKGGADSVEDVRGEYNAIAAMPGVSYENLGHYGWHAMNDGTEERDHEAEAQAGFERARELVAAAGEADLASPLEFDGDAADGVHMLVLDEVLYAADRGLVDPEAVVDLVESKPAGLELVLTGSHSRPAYLEAVADLVTNVRKEKHPIDAGQRARKGTEY